MEIFPEQISQLFLWSENMLKHKSLQQEFDISLVMNDAEDTIESILFPIGFLELDSRSRTKILNQIQTALYDEITMKTFKASGIDIEINWE